MEWVEIYSSAQEYEVLILQGMLKQNGIEAMIMNNKDSMYLFGEISLFVPTEEVIKAKRLIEEHLT